MKNTNAVIPKRKVMKGGILLSIGPIIAICLGFIVTSFIGLYIDPGSLGEYSFTIEFVSLMTTVILFGVPGAITKYLAEYIGRNDQAKIDALLKTQILLTLIFCIFSLITTFISTPFFFLFLGFDLTPVKMLIITLTIFAMIISLMSSSTIKGYYDIEQLAVFDIIASVISRILVIICILITLNVYSLLLRFLITHLILLTLILITKRKKYTMKGNIHPLRPLFSFGLPGTVSSTVVLIGGNLFLKGSILFLFGKKQVGYFDFGFRLSTLINTVTAGFYVGLTAYYSRLYGEGGVEKVGLEGGWIVKSTLLIFSPIIIGSLLIGKVLIEEVFINYLLSLPFFIILTLKILFVVTFRPFMHMADAIGKPRVKVYRVITSLPAGYLALFLTYSLGPICIAIAWVTMDLVSALTISVLCRYYIGKIVIERRKSLLCIVSAFIMGGFVYLVDLLIYDLFVAIPSMIITGMIVYFVLVRELQLVSPQEVRAVSSSFLPEKLAKIPEKLLLKE